MAITRLWFFTLQPNISPSDPAFLKLWNDVLALCARYTPSPGPSSSQVQTALLIQSCPKRAHHFLFQSTNTTSQVQQQEEDQKSESSPPAATSPDQPPIFVFISSYPSFALCTQADLAYANQYHAQMQKYVQHRALRQIDMEDAEVVPALLSSSSSTSSRDGEADGEEREEQAPTVTVAISKSDPLVAEAMSSSSASLTGAKVEVPPPHEEISGADVYVLPPVSNGFGGRKEDMFEAQRSEGKTWIRITRRVRPRMEDIDVEAYQLRELLAQ